MAVKKKTVKKKVPMRKSPGTLGVTPVNSTANEFDGRAGKMQLCRLIGLTLKSLNVHLSKPTSPRADDEGKYDIRDVRDFINEARKQKYSQPQSDSMSRYKKDKLEADAKLAKLKYEKERERLVEISDVVIWVRERQGAVKKALTTFPTQLAPRLEGLTATEISVILKEEVRNLVEQLQNYADLSGETATESVD